MRLVLMSDTHGRHNFNVPDGDVLLHAGDFCMKGDYWEALSFSKWMDKQPHQYKVAIAGNHDIIYEKKPVQAKEATFGYTYLQDSEININGIKIYGSPWQPWFYDWAFNLPRGKALQNKWKNIPKDTDILITHGPAFGQLDLTPRGELVGCEDLIETIREVNPAIHLFGHIHHSRGIKKSGRTVFVNASICDEAYRPNNKPIVLDIDPISKELNLVDA